MKKNKFKAINPTTGEAVFFTNRKAAVKWVNHQQSSKFQEGYEVYGRETGEFMRFGTMEEAQKWISDYNEMLLKSNIKESEIVN